MACHPKFAKFPPPTFTGYSCSTRIIEPVCPVNCGYEFIPVGVCIPCNIDPCYYFQNHDLTKLCFVTGSGNGGNKGGSCGTKKGGCSNCG